MFEREIRKNLAVAQEEESVVFLRESRQSGKTTLARGFGRLYRTLDDLVTLAAVVS